MVAVLRAALVTKIFLGKPVCVVVIRRCRLQALIQVMGDPPKLLARIITRGFDRSVGNILRALRN